MRAVGANAGHGSLDARARGDLEIAQTLRNRAFAAEVPVGIGVNGNADLIAQAS